MQTELPTIDEITTWLITKSHHLDSSLVPSFWMGVESLYVKLGGEPFLEIRTPSKVDDDK